MSERRVPQKLKQAVSLRAHDCCEYCLSQARFAPDPFSIEHVIPLAKGGTHDEGNLALACQGCNSRKYIAVAARDPANGNLVP